MQSIRVLFATSECAPLVKTGGLGDVSAALPAGLASLGVDVRILMPAYRGVMEQAGAARHAATLRATRHFPAADVHEAACPSGVRLYLLDCPALFDREGGPYLAPNGRDHEDNARRFGLLSHAAAVLCSASSPLDWRAQVVHCNDWQTALAPAYLHFAEDGLAGTVITVHNLAFQGIFPLETAGGLGLPAESLGPGGVEYYGRMSFLKAGLVYADAITTVSPTYAAEIQREPLGMGMTALLASRANALTGILNGIDTGVWDPANDPLIAKRFDAASLGGKAANRQALTARFGLGHRPGAPLAAMVSRLTDQKGIDLVIESAPGLIATGLQLVVLGTGEARYEQALLDLAARHPDDVGVEIGFDEGLAHQIEAGADIFLMPSRFEPCGMNQMFSQRYGTVPVVHATGGLIDSVVDCTPGALANGTATGFAFAEATAAGFRDAVGRAIAAYRDPAMWRTLQANGMRRDFSWDASARRYLEIYERLQASAKE